MGVAAVSNEEFAAVMRPLAEALSMFASAVASESERQGMLPAAESKAMRELAGEARWSTERWLEPVSATHSFGALLVYFLAEQLAAVGAIIDRSSVGPRYSYQANVRAIIDAAPVAFWLLYPSIGTDARVKRGVAYRMDSANQQGPPPRPSRRGSAEEQDPRRMRRDRCRVRLGDRHHECRRANCRGRGNPSCGDIRQPRLRRRRTGKRANDVGVPVRGQPRHVVRPHGGRTPGDAWSFCVRSMCGSAEVLLSGPVRLPGRDRHLVDHQVVVARS